MALTRDARMTYITLIRMSLTPQIESHTLHKLVMMARITGRIIPAGHPCKTAFGSNLSTKAPHAVSSPVVPVPHHPYCGFYDIDPSLWGLTATKQASNRAPEWHNQGSL